VLPVLTYTAPHAAGDALRWRHTTLGLARERAKLLGLKGAAFPWRTIDGAECSAYWPAETAAFHICADIADAVGSYQDHPEAQRHPLECSAAVSQHPKDFRTDRDAGGGEGRYRQRASTSIPIRASAQTIVVRLQGEPLQITHYDEAITVTTHKAVNHAIPTSATGEDLRQPSGRAPARRRPSE